MSRRRFGMIAAALCISAAAHAQPGALNINGTWSTQFAGAAATVTMYQSGPNVVGTYVNTPPLLPGALAGVLRGNVLTGRWTDASSSGGFTMTFVPNGRSFVGTWGRTLASTSNGGPWLGRKN